MQFGFQNPFRDKSAGATTLALTVAFNCAERGGDSILGQLDRIAARANTNTAEGISALCADTSLMLLRRSDQWISCCGIADYKGRDEDALSAFDRLIVREAAKFDDRSAGATVDAALCAAGIGASTRGKPTIAVVCIVGCLAGDREEAVTGSLQGDAGRLRDALQELAAAGNGAGEVLAFELLWVPAEDEETIEMDDVLLDWPDLMPC